MRRMSSLSSSALLAGTEDSCGCASFSSIPMVGGRWGLRGDGFLDVFFLVGVKLVAPIVNDDVVVKLNAGTWFTGAEASDC